MKLFGLLTLLFASVAIAAPVVSRGEREDWESCTNTLLTEFNQGEGGDKAACNMWSCLHDKASKYSRGGGITALSNILDPVCFVVKLNPFTSNNAPKVSRDEARDWRSCMNNLIASFDTQTSGNKAACQMWSCLHTQASKYNRGGALTALSNVLNPVCGVVGTLPFKE